jgi:dolichyl-phosphooligosaccharide-protein glycotransferase
VGKKNKIKNKSYSDKNNKILKDNITNFKIYKYPLKTYLKIMFMILLLIIPVFITYSVREKPIKLEITDKWAQDTIYNNLRVQFEHNLQIENPNLSSERIKNIAEAQFNNYLDENKEEIENYINRISSEYKSSFQYVEDNQTYTYLGDLDSYYFLRQARNLKEKGTICDEIIDGKCIDNLMVAPIKKHADKTSHPYGIYYLYKIMNFFNPKINLMYASFYLPIFFSMLIAILTFFTARKIGGDIAGFFASIFVSTSQIFLTRTMGSDNDMWNIFYPILIIFFFIYMIDSKNFKIKVIYALLIGLSFGIYSHAWSAWWFTFILFIFSFLGYLLYRTFIILLNENFNFSNIIKNNIFQEYKTFAIIFISSMIFVSIFSSFNIFISSFASPFVMIGINEATQSNNIWPNVYTTVAELKNSFIPEVISTLGNNLTIKGYSLGKIAFLFACLGVIFSMIRRKITYNDLYILSGSFIWFLIVINIFINSSFYLFVSLLSIPIIISFIIYKDREELKYGLFFFVWICATLFISLKGVRFIILLIPIAGILFGITIGKILRINYSLLNKTKINKIFIYIFMLLLFILFLPLAVKPVQNAYMIGENFLPSISSAWADSLTYIRDNSDENAIINSWWDFGHWFKYFAERRVTFDGASQNSPQAHWIGKSLLTEDEDLSIGILRMLDCGANTAFEELNNYTEDDLKSIEILYSIIVLDKDNAYQYLKEKEILEDVINKVLERTHCNPPENYFITSEDMVPKAGVWAHFGSWDFKKAYASIEFSRKRNRSNFIESLEKISYDNNQANQIFSELQNIKSNEELNSWISPWPSYLTQRFQPCSKIQENIIKCDYNTLIGRSQNQLTFIESAYINLININQSYVNLIFTDASSQRKLGESKVMVERLVIADEELVEFKIENELQIINIGLLLDVKNSRSILMDPLLSKSIFTRLYFLDGRYTENFEKFVEKRDPVRGHHIIVWKVNWN